MLAATSNNSDFYPYEVAAGAVGVYEMSDGSYSTTVTVDGKDYELSDGVWGCVAYSAITSLAEADMDMDDDLDMEAGDDSADLDEGEAEVTDEAEQITASAEAEQAEGDEAEPVVASAEPEVTDAEIETIAIHNDDEAKAQRSLGAPTVRIDGFDAEYAERERHVTT